MEYIQRIKEYISNNIKEIESPNHKLNEIFNVSDSKLQKDFKKNEGITLLKYLNLEKIKLREEFVRKGKSDDDFMDACNFNYTKKTLRNQLNRNKRNIENEVENKVLSGLDVFRNKSVFAEIFLRFILHNGWAKLKKNTVNSFYIEYAVEKTFFQFEGMMPIEKLHRYDVYLDMDSLKLSYNMYAVLNDKCARIPKTIDPYFSILYYLEHKLINSGIKYLSVAESIVDFYSYIKKVSIVSFLVEFCQLELDLSLKPIVEINYESDFIKSTNYIIEDMKQSLINSCRKKLLRLANVDLDHLRSYADCVKVNDFVKMEKCLSDEDFATIKKLDVYLQITDFPYLDEQVIDNVLKFDSAILNRIMKLSKSTLIDVIICYRKKIELLDEFEYEDYDSNKLFESVICVLEIEI